MKTDLALNSDFDNLLTMSKTNVVNCFLCLMVLFVVVLLITNMIYYVRD